MKEKLKYGLVGAGRIAQSYVQALEVCGTARLIAIADARVSAAQALAERAGCKSYESHQAMCEGSQLDAVIVCTPPATHPEICLHLLKRRIHVLCEKPLSIDVKSAKIMVGAAEKARVHLTMASKYRYVEDVIRAKSIVMSGILGEIVLYENIFTSQVDMTSRWNSNPKVSGGGVLIDNGTHSVDLMRYFLGPLVDIQVVEGKRSQGLSVEETVRMFVWSASGVMGSIDLSWSINKELDSYINIYGSHGTVCVGWKESKYRQFSSRDWVIFGKGYNKIEAFRNQLNNFSRAIVGEEELIITAEDAIASVEAIDAAYVALRRNNWIEVGGRPGRLLKGDGHLRMLEGRTQ